jgi:hypothetical protein
MGLYTVNPDGSGKQRLRPHSQANDFNDVRWIAGGKRLAFNDPFQGWRSVAPDGSDVRMAPEVDVVPLIPRQLGPR